MNSEKIRRFGIIVGTLIVMNLLKSWLFYGIFMSIFSIALGEDGTPATILTIIAATASVGVLSMLPLYWGMRENSEERRRFLAYFAEHDYNRANLRTYLKETKLVSQDRIVFLIALIVVLVIQNLPTYVTNFIFEFIIIFGIYLLFDFFVRRRLYDKWESERLHK